ncbi:kinesin light chain 2-like [Argiope bruennichi]|uniref:kinesin light chain 2-like n=1 Tax=Argiope bruennichi TaxID=94029 RepID=UPI0024950BBA|nr:kinesin light chain 2-like [Argiope bruennichi]
MEEEIYRPINAISKEANGEKALKILYMSAYFTPAKNMHLDMFSCLFNDNEEELDAAFLLLKKYYLVESHTKQAFSLKKTVQKEIRVFLRQNSKEEDVLRAAIDLQTFHLLKDEIQPNYIDHALSLLTLVRESDELIKISLGMPSHIVSAMRKHNRLGEAYIFGKEALNFLEKVVGENHAETLTLRHNLATILDAEGQHKKAVKILQELNEKDLKYSTIKEMTQSLVLRARELCELSKYKEALPLYQILIGEKTVLDTFDSEILTAWQDYALLLSDMGRHSEAISILEDVITQQKKILDKDDPYGIVTRLSLGHVLQEQGNHTQAMKQFKDTLYESVKYNGELHRDTLRAERNIGVLLLHKGNYKEALKILEEAEKKFKQILPDSHPDVLCTRANIISSLISLNEYDEALQLSKDVYETYKNKFSENHNEALTVKFNIGSIFLKQGRWNEAMNIFREVYEGFCNIFGPEHHKTVEVKIILELGS